MTDDTTYRQSDLWAELDATLRQLGAGGGLISPSIYDTAQCLRFHPPADPGPAIDWLIAQQRADGGWSTPGTQSAWALAPRARYLPTIATLLAFAGRKPPPPSVSRAIEGGLAFLRAHQEADWAVLGDDLPGGAELILPRLLIEAKELGLPILLKPYAGLADLGRRRRRHIAALPRLAGTTATHIWEGWGTLPDPAVVDGSGTVGHSPAASAAWLHMARPYPALQATRHTVEAGLAAAWQATTGAGQSLPAGVINPCWPIGDFERAFGLYPLLLAGFLAAPGQRRRAVPPAVELTIADQLRQLGDAVTTEGLGVSRWFLADGDDTAVACALLAAESRLDRAPLDPAILLRFKSGDHFCAWQGELQSAPSVTAHALQALALLGADEPLEPYGRYLLARRRPDGMWAGEPWNSSSIYATSQALIALLAAGVAAPLPEICAALLGAQRDDGSWGDNQATAEETAYAVLALLQAERSGLLPNGRRSLARARRFLGAAQGRPADGAALWLGKEPYRPARIARCFELTALIALDDLDG